MGNTIGSIFRVTTFGESHGQAIGAVIDGLPAGIEINREFIQAELDRRRPGQSEIVTQRKEGDKVEIVSGIFENRSVGTPISLIIQNQDQRQPHFRQLDRQ